MEFINEVIKNRKLIFQLGKNDFKNKFANTSLGAIWGFVQPFIFILTYAIVFQFIIRTGYTSDVPYVVWFIPGIAMWMFVNDSILSASGSIRAYSYLVKKVIFPVDIIPLISLVSTSIVGMFLVLVSIGICTLLGYMPNLLLFIYILIAAYCLIVAVTRLTSAISTLIPDFLQLISVLMQLLFWFTPIVWNFTMVGDYSILIKIMKLNPIAYLIEGMRACYTDHLFLSNYGWIYTVFFWIIVLIIFLWGNSIFKRAKKDFPDVL